MDYYLGIDGGGTKTVAAVSDESGSIILKKEGKTINFYSVGMDKARENLSSLIKEICAELNSAVFEKAFIGCSALDCEADEKTVDALCAGVINAEKLSVNSDVFVALAASGNESCRAVAVCGTGSMAIGIKDGKTCVKGGWGHIFGDEGSAYSIALNSLRACAFLRDECRETPLLQAAKEFFRLGDFREAIDVIYSPNMTKDVLAEFAVAVSHCADKDVIAKTVIINEAHSFSRTVLFLLSLYFFMNFQNRFWNIMFTIKPCFI